MKNVKFIKAAILSTLIYSFTSGAYANYWLVIGTYRQGPGGRPEVSGITSPSIYSLPMKDLETCKIAGKYNLLFKSSQRSALFGLLLGGGFGGGTGGRLAGWLAGWRVGWLAGRRVGWLVGREGSKRLPLALFNKYILFTEVSNNF